MSDIDYTVKVHPKKELDNVEKWMWKYLLKHGHVTDNANSYYGVTMDTTRTKQCLEAIQKLGINWDKTSGVKDDYDTRFNGTFAEDSLTVKYLTGELYVNSMPDKYVWYYEYESPIDILQLIGEALPTPDFEVLK